MSTVYKPAGDRAILIELGQDINEGMNAKVRSLAHLIEANAESTFTEVVLGYCTILVHYNPLAISFHEAVKQLKEWEHQTEHMSPPAARLVEIPAKYGGERGPDLTDVTELNGLTTDDVIAIHSGTRYLVYFTGFTPGFPFMGGMSKKIATPRLSEPRIRIPPGSIGIAGNQTGIYPLASPGGWRLIGQTPLRLYHPGAEQPFLLQAGDYVQFMAIGEDEFQEIEQEVKAGRYVPVIQSVSGGTA